MEEKKNILLVEDDRQLGTVVKDFLEGSGFAVEYQHNAALARAKMLLDSDLFDLKPVEVSDQPKKTELLITVAFFAIPFAFLLWLMFGGYTCLLYTSPSPRD